MSDERLRELERTWRRTGSVDDEVAFLQERVRTGALGERDVRLAAWLGHPAAERLAGRGAAFVVPEQASPAEAFWRGVLEHGELARVRTIVTAARHATRRVGEELASPRPTRAQTRARALLDSTRPPEDSLEREAWGWWRAVRQALDSATSFALEPCHEARRALQRDVALLDYRGVPLLWTRAPTAAVAAGIRDLVAAVGQLEATFAGAPPASPYDRWRGLSPARLMALRKAACAEVAPWALGTGDVLRDELAGRVDRIRVASPCDASWDDMTPIGDDGRTRHCVTCDLAVHDLAAYTAVEVDSLLRQHEGRRLCVNLYRRADGRVLTRDCPVGLEAVNRPDGGYNVRGGIG